MRGSMEQTEVRGNILYLVAPCYNEEEALPTTARVMREKLGRLIKEKKISSRSKIMFVNDGSSDDTWKIIHGLCQQDPVFWICSRTSRRWTGSLRVISGAVRLSTA